MQEYEDEMKRKQ